MARRFSAPRAPKKYVWVHTASAAVFNAAGVAEIPLVIGQDYAPGGSLGPQAHTLNIIRVIGDIHMQAGEPGILDNIGDIFIYGPGAWGLYIQDIDSTDVIDPTGISATDEESLGTGIIPAVGLGIDTSAFVSGTGLGVAFAHDFPFQTQVHLDIRSNRRLDNDEQLQLNLTRIGTPAISLADEEDFTAMVLMRTLIKLP